ncbi:uncharacterized protein PAC_00037 [Phialocephala subalpina]|uniref:SCP domain-containing protein n=1 Tax=Phialocephala subalpina TaxID=576137 RepID=A0A1L7WBL1_9HELO|nr:uncharacterized protein PAC_00037 [Phialocephala subalpina]
MAVHTRCRHDPAIVRQIADPSPDGRQYSSTKLLEHLLELSASRCLSQKINKPPSTCTTKHVLNPPGATRQPLTWSNSLITEAQAYADKLASRNSGLKHDSQRTHGENQACSGGGLRIDFAKASQYWIDEKKDYRGEKIGGSGHQEWGHYTQIIWPGCTKMGMGIAVSRSGVTFVVARYDRIQMKGEYPYTGTWSNAARASANVQPQTQPQIPYPGSNRAQAQRTTSRQHSQGQPQQPPPRNPRLRPAGIQTMIQEVIQDFTQIDGERRRRDPGQGQRGNGSQVRVVGASEVIGTLKELWGRHKQRHG